MDFTSIAFLAFLTAAAILYGIAPRRAHGAVLLASSYLFYGFNDPRLLALLVFDTALVFCAALGLQRLAAERTRTMVTLLLVAFLIGALVFFKGAFLLPGASAWHLLLPLGVSYYTFKLVGYVLDVYWRAIEPERNVVDFAAFVAFFPQIVAGPIQRSEQFLPQLHPPVSATRGSVLLGTQRILLGFFKKFVVADNLAVLVNYIYTHLHGGGEPILLGFYGYPLQMYADFSALTDISIGAALLFGMVAPENFEAPFTAVSPSDYWRRWHITLTLWLTDYVFTPLRMSTRRLGNPGLVFSLMVNMVLIGLWHGFRWTFVVFGLLHAVYLSIDALTVKQRRKLYKKHPRAQVWAGRIGPVSTFHLVAIAFVCFRAQTCADIVYVLSHLFTGISHVSLAFSAFWSSNERTVAVGVCGYFIAEVGDFLRRRNARAPILGSLPRWSRWSVYSCSGLAVCLLLLLLLVNGGKASPFLYAIF